jgi:hypothetical protein
MTWHSKQITIVEDNNVRTCRMQGVLGLCVATVLRVCNTGVEMSRYVFSICYAA